MGIQSIICLLDDRHLNLYQAVPGGLIAYYRSQGFDVAHLPAQDHQDPPLAEEQLTAVWLAYQCLPKPVLVHCSAGIDRTGAAIEFIERHLIQQGSQ